MSRQLALPLTPKKTSGDDGYIVTACNEQLHRQLMDWHSWPYGCAILCGPAGSGKSAMGRAFARESGGQFVDQADQHDEEALFHLWNRAQNEGFALLLASRKLPHEWNTALPDLKSRLGAAHLLLIEPPDPEMVALLIQKIMLARGVMMSEYKAAFAAMRLPRSYGDVAEFAAQLDRLALERSKPVTLAMIRELLEAGGDSGES